MINSVLWIGGRSTGGLRGMVQRPVDDARGELMDLKTELMIVDVFMFRRQDHDGIAVARDQFVAGRRDLIPGRIAGGMRD